MSELGDFQDAFERAMTGEASALARWLAPIDAPGMAVYRNTGIASAIDALADAYATVVRMVGDPWFRAAAALYVRAKPPSEPSLIEYGGDFGAWLTTFEPASDTPYLVAIADIDWLCRRAYFSADAQPLDPARLSGVEESELSSVTLELHPSVQLAAFDVNVASLWRAHQSAEAPPPFELKPGFEAILLARPHFEMRFEVLGPGAFAFCDACRRKRPLLAAADEALDADRAASLAEIVKVCGRAGAFARLTRLGDDLPG